MNLQQAKAQWAAHRALHEEKGIYLPGVVAYMPNGFKANYAMAMDALAAMDAQPTLTTTANAGIPAFLTTIVDPAVFQVLFAENKGADILGEVKKGSWLDETAMFPTVEHTGEVSSYGDWNENGSTSVNEVWPQRQAYLFQTIKEYGERALERAGLGRINLVSEIDQAAATVLGKYANLTYFYGVAGLQNYGLLNDPNLSAAITPTTKAANSGTQWILNGKINATANEVFADIQALFYQLVAQTNGLVNMNDELILAMSPLSEVAMTATNSFNVTVSDLLKKSFPNIRVETAVQYGAKSASNPQGAPAGNTVQLIAPKLQGQQTGYCAFNEKMRAHAIVKGLSSFKQKMTGGTWGAVIRMPMAIAQMVGV
jgi:hypothetical protein